MEPLMSSQDPPVLPPDHPLWDQLQPQRANATAPSFYELKMQHNQYCRDDWDMYHGAGPRGMGPAGNGCVCLLEPPGYGEPKPTFADIGWPEDWPKDGVTHISVSSDPESKTHPMMDEFIRRAVIAEGPRLWDVEPDTVVHIAGACVYLFGRYIRQRCEWCGIILVEYDLQRVAVPIGQPGEPAHWEPGSLVRVDGALSASIEDVPRIDGDVQLPMDSCAFDPKTQIQ
jgi:hypothetical protein